MDLQDLAREKFERAYRKIAAGFHILKHKILQYKKVQVAVEFSMDLYGQARKKYVQLQFKRRNYRERKLLRYIVKQLLAYFLVMYLFFFLIFFVNQIMLFMKQLLGKHIPLGDAMKLMFYSLPFVIAQSAPFATLTGFLMCLGRMNTDNEILIFKASGYHLGRLLLRPILIMGVLISIFSFFVNDYLLPLGTSKTRDQLRKSISQNP
ncbi:MAG: LptF/LptG family permease, partial [Treponema sp.]|nr:LptF/LptG family permease [Treponema sp.]